MDRFDRVIPNGVCNVSSTKTRYEVLVSYDQFLSIVHNQKFSHMRNYPVLFLIDDQAVVSTREECMARYQFLKYINQFPNAEFEFRLSDSSLPAYISFMNSVGWKHDSTTDIYMNVDRNPIAEKNIPIEDGRGRLHIPEEKLMWFSDKKLQLAKNKIDRATLNDTLRLKQIVLEFICKLNQKYPIEKLDDFEKAYLAYHYLFDPKCAPQTALTPLGITFANSRTYNDQDGVQRLRRSITRWESKPVGTYDHRKGVCTGQARLFTSLICNPYLMVPAERVVGTIPSGERHCWSEFLINHRIYQCCTTMKGLFANLDSYGYKHDADEYFSEIYPHGTLYYNQVEMIKNHVKSIKK